ncbi:MAG: hypothetical protein H6811_02940 [Phycisphaeraceae bacterium]|nr:hypothetical protein [Phycisphaeraceae bacterium]
MASIAAAIALATVARAQPSIGIGAEFPVLEMPSMVDGHPMSMARFRGQKIMLHVFASW